MSRPLLSRKPVRLLIIFTLVFFVSLPIIRPLGVVTAQSPDQNQYYNRDFAWDYDGNHWTWNLSIPVALYDAYKAVPDSTRIQNGPAGYDFCVTTKDSYLQGLVEKLNETVTQLGYGSLDQVSFVLAFVQSIPYKSDLNTTGYEEYPRFPIETLVDQAGDCDCKAVLFATLTLMMGYGAVFINPTDHLAVGVLGNDLSGTYWTYENRTYYYAETTGTGFKVGELPDEFKGQSAYVYPIDESHQYVLESQAMPSNEPAPTISPNTPASTPTLEPNPAASPSPTIAEPTSQPVEPLSFNLIADNPILFILIVLAIVISITVAVKSAKKPKEPPPINQTVSPEPSIPQVTDTNLEGNKFCIYCGSSNKAFALYCEKCGKKIA
ncbi:MAG: hypothetical protein ABSB71_03770 [Candidatus Bathyarchaeia archaeon]|jgi:hypothetical protein